MSKTFAGFSPKAVTFLRQLRKNNSRDWFQPRKPQFDELLHKPMLDLTGRIADKMRGFAVDYVRDPAKAVHRIYRDVRFSRDKSPYKTNISAMFFRAGLSKNATAGFYFSVSPDGVDIAGGLYMPGPAELLAIRKAILHDPATFQKQIDSKPLRKVMGDCQGEGMVRLPKGFETTDPRAMPLIRRKQFYYMRTLDPTLATEPGIEKQIVTAFQAMAPVIEFINQILLASVQESAGPSERPVRPKPMF
jgi:uncharacterized protein (TIGR02453 family)